MKPVYFPHTFLPASAACALQNLFPSVAVYQATAGRVPEEMQPFVESGFLEVIAPAVGDADDIDRLIRELEKWGHRHHGGSGLEAAVMHRFAFEGLPNPDESLYSIASQLKRRISSGLPDIPSDTLLASRVFLQLAQAADQKRHQIDVELDRYDRFQAHLFCTLNGQKDPALHQTDSASGDLQPHDFEDRVELRAAAWARLFVNHPYPSPVFVTPSMVLIRHLSEIIQGRREVSLRDLATAAREASGGRRPPPEQGTLQLLEDVAAGRIILPEQRFIGPQAPYADRHVEEDRLHVWLDVSPYVFFSRIASDPVPLGHQPPALASWHHTIVIHLSGFTKTTSRLDTPI